MIIDNFNIITDVFDDNVYHQYNSYSIITVQNRVKDGIVLPEGFSESKLIYKTFFINSIKDIEKHKPLIKYLCDNLHARAYITTTPRTFPKFYKNIINGIVDNLVNNKDYHNMNISELEKYERYIDDVSRNTEVIDNQYYHLYLLDIDTELSDYSLNIIKDYLGNLYKCCYKTINGHHILLSKYNPITFKTFIRNTFKDNPTLNNFIEHKGKGCRALLYANIEKIN